MAWTVHATQHVEALHVLAASQLSLLTLQRALACKISAAKAVYREFLIEDAMRRATAAPQRRVSRARECEYETRA